jgi:hypothetical protein
MGPVNKGHGRSCRIGPMIASHALPFFCPPFQPKRGEQSGRSPRWEARADSGGDRQSISSLGQQFGQDSSRNRRRYHREAASGHANGP